MDLHKEQLYVCTMQQTDAYITQCRGKMHLCPLGKVKDMLCALECRLVQHIETCLLQSVIQVYQVSLFNAPPAVYAIRLDGICELT